jgi:hypothetical protein
MRVVQRSIDEIRRNSERQNATDDVIFVKSFLSSLEKGTIVNKLVTISKKSSLGERTGKNKKINLLILLFLYYLSYFFSK